MSFESTRRRQLVIILGVDFSEREKQLQRCWDRGALKRAKTVIDNDSDNGRNTANVARTLPGLRNLELYAKHVHAYLYSRTT